MTDLIAEDDRVYVRWRQDSRDDAAGGLPPAAVAGLSAIGSAVYRVHEERVAEYWSELDRPGLSREVEATRREQR